MNLKNKKIIITGATGGIGNTLVKKFLELGAEVLATGTNEEKLKKLKNALRLPKGSVLQQYLHQKTTCLQCPSPSLPPSAKYELEGNLLMLK